MDTRTIETPIIPQYDMSAMDRMISIMRDTERNLDRLPHRVIARKKYFDAIIADIPMHKDAVRDPIQHVSHAKFFGCPVYIDETLPEGVMARFLNQHGAVIGEITLPGGMWGGY